MKTTKKALESPKSDMEKMLNLESIRIVEQLGFSILPKFS